MVDLYIFDKDENLLAILGNENQINNYFDAVHIEIINGENRLEFSLPADQIVSQDINEGGFVGFLDLDNDFQFFEIKRIEEVHGDTLSKRIFSEHNVYELLDEFVVFIALVGQTPTQILDFLLNTEHASGAGISRWSVGIVEVTDLTTLRLRLVSVYQSILDLVAQIGGELRFRLEFDGTNISNRYIDILERRGSDTGKRFEYGQDIKQITKEIDANNVITALYGFGRGEEIVGVGKQSLRFRDVEFINELIDGRLVNKPRGQIFVEDPIAKAQFGREGGTKNRFALFIDEEQFDETQLLIDTWRELQEVNTPQFSIAMGVVDLEALAGVVAQKTRLGDSVVVIDDEFNPPLEEEARIIEFRRFLVTPENNEITLSNIRRDISEDGEVLRQNTKMLKESEGVWEENKYIDNLIRDGSFENVKRVGSADADQSFSVDQTNPSNFNSFAWTWGGNDPRIISVVGTGLFLESLFDLQGALISDESRPRISYVPHQSVGFAGPYTASVYVAPILSSVDGNGILELFALKGVLFENHVGDGITNVFFTNFSPIFDENVPNQPNDLFLSVFVDFSFQEIGVDYFADFETGRIEFVSTPSNGADIEFNYEHIQKRERAIFPISGDPLDAFDWKRIRVTWFDLPSDFDVIEMRILTDVNNSPNRFQADGAQIVPMPNPVAFEPLSDFYAFLQGQEGVRLENPEFLGQVSKPQNASGRKHRTGNLTVTRGTNPIISFQQTDYSVGLIDQSVSTFEIVYGGTYLVVGAIAWSSTFDNQDFFLGIRVNDDEIRRISAIHAGTTNGNIATTGSAIIKLGEGDLVRLIIRASGTGTSVVVGGSTRTYFEIERLG